MNNPSIGDRRYKPRLRPKSGWPELTALIDVMFLVMLFLFLSSSFVRVSGIRVNPPRVRPSSVADLEKFVVTIARNSEGGRLLYFNDRPVTLESLKQQFNEVHGRSLECNDHHSGRPGSHARTRAPEVMALAEAAELASFLVTSAPDTRPETRLRTILTERS